MSYSARQKKVKATVHGAKEIVRTLKAMEDAASGVLLNSARAGGKIALEDAKQHCPVDTGALKNSLKIENGKATQTKATVEVNYDKSIKYGTYVELGVRGRKPNPFLRNAVDKNQEKINEAIKKEISNQIGGVL